MLNHKALILGSLIALGAASAPAMARVNLDFEIGVPPPAARVEVVPAPRDGYTWSPGYYNWEDGQHVWVDGYWQPNRVGFVWVPDAWEHNNGRHHYYAGHWERHH